MLYDPLAVKRLASAVCVLPPTPRSLIGPSGCQGCASASTTESAREPGLDAGAPGRLYCEPSQEEEQQRPGVGHGIVFGACPSQENLAQGKGRAWGAERSRTEPFRKKDQATYLQERSDRQSPHGEGGRTLRRASRLSLSSQAVRGLEHWWFGGAHMTGQGGE